MDTMDMKKAISIVTEGKNLTTHEAEMVMELLLTGVATQAQIGAFLTAMRMKGETIDEITGLAKILKSKALKIAPKVDKFIDFVGTGGDCTYTFNISTTSAFVVAGASVPVAKHGNRSISSKSGAGDVLEALGVNIMSSPQKIEQEVEEIGIGFMFAPNFNESMKYVGQARKEMGVRTVFNILGPLSNPSNAKALLVGVYQPYLTEVIAGVMKNMGVKRALVTYGSDGMDEITLTGHTTIAEIKNDEIKVYDITPEQFGFKRCTLDELRGGDGKENAKITRGILDGTITGPMKDVILFNAGAAIYVADEAADIEEGIKKARVSLESGKALEVLDKLIAAD